MTDLLSTWLSPTFLRTLLLDPDKSKSTCIQIARFVAAYYLDYLLFLPAEEGNLPSLYLWGNLKEEDLKPTDVVLDRVKVSAMLPAEFSPALPALLMVKCDSLIEAISYADHFDDRRTSLVLRLLADSLHVKDLTTDYIKSMIMDNLEQQIEESSKNNSMSKFSQTFTESILQLDVAMQTDLVLFLEQHLISTAEFIYSELPLESEEVLPNPVYESPGKSDSDESKAFTQIYGYILILLDSYARSNRITEQLNCTVKILTKETLGNRVSASLSLHRVLLLMLRITYRHLFSTSLKQKNKAKTDKIVERYKVLLREEDGEHELLQKWFETAEEEEKERVQHFIDWMKNNYEQTASLPPLHAKSRELWLRRIVLNSTTNHRDLRQERTIDWFRSVCHPKHRVCDVVMSQMLFVNSQWTSPGFTFIQPGCLALRLSIHPHDLCLGTTSSAANFSVSARDILYSPRVEFANAAKEDGRLFTPREPPPTSPDLISKYARTHQELTAQMAQTARFFNPFEKQMRIFTRQQDQLQREVMRETEFLSRAELYDYPESNGEASTPLPSKHIADEALARQLNLLNEKLDIVVKGLAERGNRSMYIREDDEESEIADLPLHYDDAPVSKEAPTIEKLDFGLLSSRTPAPIASEISQEELKGSSMPEDQSHLSTAKSFTNPLFASSLAGNLSAKSSLVSSNKPMPLDWMRMLPLEPVSERFVDNLLTYDNKGTTSATDRIPVSARKVVSDRGIQTTTTTTTTTTKKQYEETRKIGETQTDSGFLEGSLAKSKKTVDMSSIRELSQDDIRNVLNKVSY